MVEIQKQYKTKCNNCGLIAERDALRMVCEKVLTIIRDPSNEKKMWALDIETLLVIALAETSEEESREALTKYPIKKQKHTFGVDAERLIGK